MSSAPDSEAVAIIDSELNAIARSEVDATS
jgi:hypothetical protein